MPRHAESPRMCTSLWSHYVICGQLCAPVFANVARDIMVLSNNFLLYGIEFEVPMGMAQVAASGFRLSFLCT